MDRRSETPAGLDQNVRRQPVSDKVRSKLCEPYTWAYCNRARNDRGQAGPGLLHAASRSSWIVDKASEGPEIALGIHCTSQQRASFLLVAKAPYASHTTIGETKASFLGYANPVPFPEVRFLDIAAADQRECACIKSSAIATRKRSAIS